MKGLSFNFLFLSLIITLFFHFSLNQRFNPEEFVEDDQFFKENDVLQNYYFSLIDAKVLTKENIHLYLKKQGIHLSRDDCCQNYDDFNVTNEVADFKSDFKEIYSNAKYRPSSNRISYTFPVDKIENIGYKLYHKVNVFNKNAGSQNLNVYLEYKNPEPGGPSEEMIFQGTISNRRYLFFELEIRCESVNDDTVVYYKNIVKISNTQKELKGKISSIIFEFPGVAYSPAIAMHWTYLKITIAISNFSFKGNSLCDKITNPCVSGYYCTGGICKKCHPSCFDCVNGGLSTDCYSKCNTHSVTPTPEKGRCSIGYVDLNQFDDFKIENIVPPPRNNRLTISFWMFVSAFPETETIAYLNNSFSENINFEFVFSTDQLKIKCANTNITLQSEISNSWFFVKCAISYDQSYQKNSLYAKSFSSGTHHYYHPNINPITINNYGHKFKKYYEPDDFIYLNFLNFNKLKNREYICNVYMKQLVVFREFLPEPYDNKYFNMENLISGNTLELPEILFIIPFDELIIEHNLYKIKSYSYQEKVEINEIILSPKESDVSFDLYPPKRFKRLYLLDKNKEFTNPELISTRDITLNNNELIAAREGLPLSCEDKNFLNFYDDTFSYDDPDTYKGECSESCPSNPSNGKIMLFGLGVTKGFCNRKYSDDANVNYDSIKDNLIKLKEKFQCNTNYYNMFYYCETDGRNENKNNFYYDPNYSPGNIVLDLRSYNLKSYIIEFWYFISECGKITSGYIFYTDQIQIKKVENSYNVYTTSHDIRGNFEIHGGYWNQIVLEVYYDPRADRNHKTKVYLQTNYNSGYASLIDESENDYKLNYIYFCNGRRASCNNLDLNWYCGYYRKLRLFNGNMAQRHVTFRYDEFYPNFLVSSILLYLPLYGEYIAGNILTQFKSGGIETIAPITTIQYTSNTWNFPQYNYGDRGDEACPATFCNRCLDGNNCYGCDNTYLLDRENGGKNIICTSEIKYFIKLQPAPKIVNLNTAIPYLGITVNFFIKLFGFEGTGETDIVILGDNLKISYNPYPDNEYFGLNLKSYVGSSEKVISNYYDFRKHFGLWTFISVATFNDIHKDYFPPMVRFEINQKKMPIVGPLDYLDITKIEFGNKIYGLIQKLKVYDAYIIGVHSFETNGAAASILPTPNISKFEPTSVKSDCENQNDGGNTCDMDKDEDLLKFNSPTILNKYNYFVDESKLDMNKDCDINCDICFGDSEYDCSCNYKNGEEKLFLGSVSNHYCAKYKYINFAGADQVRLLDVPTAEKKFTLHFWVFAHSYVDYAFEGLEIEWLNQLTIEIKIDSSNRYNFICTVDTISTTPIEIKMDAWNFIHCAADYIDHKIYYTTEEYSFYTDFYLERATPTSSTTNLTISDKTDINKKEWGILFYKSIRLWNDAFQYSAFLSRIKIENSYFPKPLLQQWQADYNQDKNMKETGSSNTYTVYYNNKVLGTNIIAKPIYDAALVDIMPCTETGEYYDINAKGNKCVHFIELADSKNDIIIDDIDVAFSHNYGIAFWILMENHTDITHSIDITWQYHMQISLKYEDDSVFRTYCFPQNYKPYSNIIEKDDTEMEPADKASNVMNNVIKEYRNDLGGEWTWIQCSLSYNNRYFYLNDEKKSLISETLYSYNGAEIKNDEPLGYFFNSLETTKSKLTIHLNNYSSKVYLRCLYLFKDYLPYNYNFKYMDMYQIDKEEFPPLTFAMNFAEFESKPTDNIIEFKYKKYSSLENLMLPGSIPVEFNNSPIKELSANFIFLPLCKPTENEKYNPDTNLCEEIENCDKTALNCLYCMGENKPLVCKTNYYINIDEEKDQVECLNYCKGNFFRSPGTLPTQGICGTDCIDSENLLTCPNTAASILSYQSDFECKTGFNRIGYQCFETPSGETNGNYGALFYSGINNPYNIYQSFTNDFITLIGSGYVLEFWFMIDNVIYGKDNFDNDKKYHYFFASPHEIYVVKETDGLKYHYSFNGREASDTLPLDQYEWNKILIFADGTISNHKQIRLFVNFGEESINLDPGDDELTLVYIAFCSGDPKINFPVCVSSGISVNWASAFYRNIRIWNIYTSNIYTIQSYINGIYKEYPQSLILFYPLTIQYLDNNRMTNIMTNLEEHISFKCESVGKCGVYNKDNIIIYNYSSKFDWGLGHEKQFVLEIDENNIIKEGNCSEHCLRCFIEDEIKECYECEKGYVLQYKECKNAEKFYFMKTPTTAPINFVLENDQGNPITNLKGFTIVFWMKFFGVPYSTVTEYCSILSLDSNTYLAFHRSTNNLVILENSKLVFSDNKFREYFGIWIPISIADYISGEQNNIYPNMFTLSVNRRDIPFCEGYSLPSTGIKVNQLQFGTEIIALFAELSIYSKFIQGAYGTIRSPNLQENLFYNKSLIGTDEHNCVDVDKDLISSVTILCSPDYSLNFNEELFCNDTTIFFEPYDENNKEKDDNDFYGKCDDICETLCFGETDKRCTCDMTDGIFWLRRNDKMETYCERIPYFDFGNIKEYKYEDAPMSETKEYTIEFWLFVYSYNQVTMNFKNMYIEWNYHNRLRLYNEQNSLKVNCQPIWKDHDFISTNYPDVKQGSLKYYQWNYVRCGTDYKNKKYFLNTIVEYDIKTKPEFFIDIEKENKEQSSDNKYFRIYRGSDFLVNFGYVFIRELKLWRQYNLDFLDSQYIYFDISNITKLKEDFPGLLLYYKNEYDRSLQNNPVITEILSNYSTELGRDPDYVGYNIVDPTNMGYAKNLTLCPYGQTYYDVTEDCRCPDGYEKNLDDICVPEENEEAELCKVVSNLQAHCLKCKSDNVYLNKWLLEFEYKCYYDCPKTLFEDPKMNQCRRCHETCYECYEEDYNNCISCTGELYFNFKEDTCIPNCQTAGLTRSLTQSNKCVIFDADASLVNVDTLTPIDVNNFNYIETKIINPTSPEYKTLWLFDVEQTNSINKELGFDDLLKSDATPFVGDLTNVKVDLKQNFFKIKHKYVFGIKIYVIKDGVEVPIYVWWTLTMNAPPFNGELVVMPYLGLYNTTTFIMRCVNFLDENTPEEDIEYNFYYIEVNTNSKIKLTSDFSLNNEVYSNFTVRYYQLDYSDITIYCQARDKFGAISEASNVIRIVNKKNSPLYNLKQIISTFYIVDDPLTDIQLLARAEVLMSLGINPYTSNNPEKFFTTYESSLTGEKVEMNDPFCISGYCNDNGECQVIDVAMTCHCLGGYLGKECFLDKDGYTDLSYYYKKLYQRLIDRATLSSVPFNDIVFKAFYKLFFAAQKFFQEENFFQTNMVEFKNYYKDYLKENQGQINEDRINKIFDLDEFFFNYFYIRENKVKLQNKINENYPFRNRTLTVSEYSVYQEAYKKFFEMIDEDTKSIIEIWGEDYVYQSEHFSYYLKRIDENFDDASFFESLKTVWVTYKPVVLFMNCLREKKPIFGNDYYYFNYVEYAVNPLSYESQFYPNITSPLISVNIYDSNGNKILINNCPSYSPIKIQLPFYSYDWINYINKQKWLFLPENYKIETDPVFRDPILIWENGSVSDDTVEERILKYYRYYNIVGLVYTPDSLTLYEYTSFLFKNISDTFLLMFETNHLSSFTSMLIPNIMNFVVDGRFYYLPRYEVLLCLDNHIHNPVFFIWISLLGSFILISIFFIFYDYQYFDNLEILDFLKKEIIKVHFPYNQLKFGLNDENIYNLIPKESKLKKGSNRQYKKMFKDYDLEDIKENDEDNNDDINNINIEKRKNSKLNNKLTEIEYNYSTARSRFVNNNENNKHNDNNIKNDKEGDKITELRSTRKINSKRKSSSKKVSEKENAPPKKKRNILSDKINSISDKFSNKTKSNKEKISLENKEEQEEQKEDQNENKGYGEGDLNEDFNEDEIEENINSEKNTLESKLSGKISKVSNTNSSNSKKKYYYGKYGTKANLISLQRFHNKAGRTNVDNDGIPLDIINEEEERRKAILAYTRLSVSTFVFFCYNLKVRHILVAPFINLTLFNNRWKKLMVLLTQIYIQQLAISVALTMNEKIIMGNILGILIVSILSCFIADNLIYLLVFLFQSSNYQRKRLYRLVMMGENFTVTKAWQKLKRQMNFKLFFGLIFVLGIWTNNFYITLIFTSVWKYQRSTWITCFFLSLFFDLVLGELLIEGLCAFCFSQRAKNENLKLIGESLNRLRAYRTMWP